MIDDIIQKTIFKSIESDYFAENAEKADRCCLECRHLHIGRNVAHNHCNYPFDRSVWDGYEMRANGRDTFTMGECIRKNAIVKNWL